MTNKVMIRYDVIYDDKEISKMIFTTREQAEKYVKQTFLKCRIEKIYFGKKESDGK